MSKSPITVQQWINALPQPPIPPIVPTPVIPVPMTPVHQITSPPIATSTRSLSVIGRGLSLQSDDASSHCSSVESVLESRRPDPEAVLLGLGFGPPVNSRRNISRIPQRFLKPSQLLQNFDFSKFFEQPEEIHFEQMYSLPSSPARQTPKTC